jgi:predicted CoA-binding protein
MKTMALIDEFLGGKTLAVVGVSGKRHGFGYMVYNDLKAKGFVVYPVNPNTNIIDGDRCYSSVQEIPEKVDGVVLVIPPVRTERVVREIVAAGIKRVWMQQGAESDTAIKFCEENGISVVHGECIMMFAKPTAFLHRAHRWVRGAVGKLPE